MKNLASNKEAVTANKVEDGTNSKVGASRPTKQHPDYSSMQIAIRQIARPCGFDALKEFYNI